jgi:hypothetical protein
MGDGAFVFSEDKTPARDSHLRNTALHLRTTDNAPIRNPMAYTLGQASKATGKDRATISRAIRKGRLSAGKDEHGQWEIDPAELHRVYPATETGNSPQQVDATDNAPIRNTDLLIENRELVAKLEAVLEREQLKDGIIDELRTDRDHWRQQATALLTDQRPREDRDQQLAAKADAGQKAEKRERRSLGQILFGFPPRQR